MIPSLYETKSNLDVITADIVMQFNTINRSNYRTARIIDLLKEIKNDTKIIQRKTTLRVSYLYRHVFVALTETK